MSVEQQCSETTVMVVMAMPEGRDWAWLADCNVLAVSDRLDVAGQERAISEAQDTWRRHLLARPRLVSVPAPAA